MPYTLSTSAPTRPLIPEHGVKQFLIETGTDISGATFAVFDHYLPMGFYGLSIFVPGWKKIDFAIPVCVMDNPDINIWDEIKPEFIKAVNSLREDKAIG